MKPKNITALSKFECIKKLDTYNDKPGCRDRLCRWLPSFFGGSKGYKRIEEFDTLNLDELNLDELSFSLEDEEKKENNNTI